MKIKPNHRKILIYYLKEFYKRYSEEKYTIFHFNRYLKKRLKNNKDAWIGVSGETGGGKSYFILMNGILFGRPFDLTKNMTYIPKGKEIVEKFSKLKFNIFGIDEAAKEMRSVNWQSKSQQDVNMTAMTERWMNNAVFLAMPNFDEFTKSMRRTSILFRAIVVYRTKEYARVIIQRKSRNWRSPDPWGDDVANKQYERFEKRKQEITNEVILAIERSIPNTIMDFIIPNLELILPKVTEEYKRLKKESRKIDEQLSLSDPKFNVYKDKYELLMTKVTKLIYNNELDIGAVKTTKQEVANALGVGIVTFNKYLLSSLEDLDKKPKHRKEMLDTIS